jgi:hypothetical protein
LNQIGKSYERNRKGYITKKEEEEGSHLGQPGAQIPASNPTQPSQPSPGTLCFLFLSQTGGTHLSSPTFSRYSSLVTAADHAPLPPLIRSGNDSPTTPIRPPHLPLHYSPSLSSDCAPRLPELLAGLRGVCRNPRSNSAPTVSESPSFFS